MAETFAYFASGNRLRYFEEEAGGLSLLRVELPERREQKRLICRAGRFLRRAGICHLLNGADGVERYGLRVVETGSLYRANAAKVAIEVLKYRRMDPAHTVIGLRGNRWTREMSAACRELAPKTRSLSLALPEPALEEAAWELQQKFGLSVAYGDGDLTLCFHQCPAGKGRLLLGEERPKVERVQFGRNYPQLPADAAEGLCRCRMELH